MGEERKAPSKVTEGLNIDEEGTAVFRKNEEGETEAVGRLDVPRIRLHDLRHSWASLALAAGVNPKVVSERLGHATVAFTLDTYSHVAPGLQEDAAERVAALIATLNAP